MNLTPRENEALARLAVSDGLSFRLTNALLAKGTDIGDNAIWLPAQRAFLESMIQSAQLMLAKMPPPDDAEEQHRRGPAYPSH